MGSGKEGEGVGLPQVGGNSSRASVEGREPTDGNLRTRCDDAGMRGDVPSGEVRLPSQSCVEAVVSGDVGMKGNAGTKVDAGTHGHGEVHLPWQSGMEAVVSGSGRKGEGLGSVEPHRVGGNSSSKAFVAGAALLNGSQTTCNKEGATGQERAGAVRLLQRVGSPRRTYPAATSQAPAAAAAALAEAPTAGAAAVRTVHCEARGSRSLLVAGYAREAVPLGAALPASVTSAPAAAAAAPAAAAATAVRALRSQAPDPPTGSGLAASQAHDAVTVPCAANATTVAVHIESAHTRGDGLRGTQVKPSGHLQATQRQRTQVSPSRTVPQAPEEHRGDARSSQRPVVGAVPQVTKEAEMR